MDLLQSTAALFSRFSRRFFPSKPAAPRGSEPRLRGPRSRSLGRIGEDTAARHLVQIGYRILYRNFRAPHGGEVDLVCRHGTTLVFVEVKTRRSARHGRPASAVHPGKQRLIARGALAWLRMLNHPSVPIRFDIVEVVMKRPPACSIHVVLDAFQLPESWSA